MPSACARTVTLLTLLTKNNDLGSRSDCYLVEGISKLGDSGGRIDHVATKDAVLPSEATPLILSGLSVAKYLHLPTFR